MNFQAIKRVLSFIWRNGSTRFVLVSVVTVAVCHSLDPVEVKRAQDLLENNYLSSPATAKWHEKQVLKKEGKWVHTYFRLDAQNAYGATVRANLCVIYKKEDNWITWDKGSFVLDNCIPSNEGMLEQHRRLNGWEEDKKATDAGTQ